jgi:hypothetical protein|tara:strand:- start:103 stop:528 length:426 start_codon:yes stop_codon:yes gene_type:complete
MAGVTKVHGDSNPVVNVGDVLTQNANAVIINTGISSPLSAYSFQFVAGDISGELKRGTNGTAGAVETLLNAISGNATVLAYQVDIPVAANSQVSVLLERSSWTSAAAMQLALRATLAANIGANGPMTTTTMAVNNNGLKLA